jgi:hypothetical protein
VTSSIAQRDRRAGHDDLDLLAAYPARIDPPTASAWRTELSTLLELDAASADKLHQTLERGGEYAVSSAP